MILKLYQYRTKTQPQTMTRFSSTMISIKGTIRGCLMLKVDDTQRELFYHLMPKNRIIEYGLMAYKTFKSLMDDDMMRAHGIKDIYIYSRTIGKLLKTIKVK